jgi:hypothetical protein
VSSAGRDKHHEAEPKALAASEEARTETIMECEVDLEHPDWIEIGTLQVPA